MAILQAGVTDQVDDGVRAVRAVAVRAVLLTAIAAAMGSAGCATHAAVATTVVSPSDWAAVEALTPRTRVVVDRHEGAPVPGAVRAVSARAIDVDTNAAAVTVPRAEVSRVLRLSGSNRRVEGAARGALIGGAVGVLQGLLLTRSNRLLFVARFSAGWASLGAALGAASGAGAGETSVVVYAAAGSGSQPERPSPPARVVSPD